MDRRFAPGNAPVDPALHATFHPRSELYPVPWTHVPAVCHDDRDFPVSTTNTVPLFCNFSWINGLWNSLYVLSGIIVIWCCHSVIRKGLNRTFSLNECRRSPAVNITTGLITSPHKCISASGNFVHHSGNTRYSEFPVHW